MAAVGEQRTSAANVGQPDHPSRLSNGAHSPFGIGTGRERLPIVEVSQACDDQETATPSPLRHRRATIPAAVVGFRVKPERNATERARCLVACPASTSDTILAIHASASGLRWQRRHGFPCAARARGLVFAASHGGRLFPGRRTGPTWGRCAGNAAAQRRARLRIRCDQCSRWCRCCRGAATSPPEAGGGSRWKVATGDGVHRGASAGATGSGRTSPFPGVRGRVRLQWPRLTSERASLLPRQVTSIARSRSGTWRRELGRAEVTLVRAATSPAQGIAAIDDAST